MFWLFVFLVHVSQHALGVEVVRWDKLRVHEYDGADSVQLSCSILRWFGEVSSVVWSRFDLNPPTIQQYGTDAHKLNPEYSGRTSISVDSSGFFSRNFSLILRRPRPSDNAVYNCSFRCTGIGVLFVTTVELQISADLVHWRFQFIFCFMTLVLLGVLGVSVILWKNTIMVTRVEVKEGELSVVLPYRTMVKLPEDVTVEWSRCAPDPMKVHVYHNEGHRLVGQDEIYRRRTSMKTDCLNSRDLSLTLKDPCYRDSGTYICTVHRGRDIVVQGTVQLLVQVVQESVQVGDWAKTFMLPFITTAQLPADATVEWRRSEPRDMVVHVYENGQDQPYRQDECYHGKTMMNSDPLRSKDLSVSIHNSGLSDSGMYTCTVRREGYILAQKEVRLVVTFLSFSSGDVEVDQMEKTVKLPWVITANLPQDASVTWSRFNSTTYINAKVHVFEDGQDQPDQQDEIYQGRTTMRKNPMQTGDLSLTLKNPTLHDSGGYNCTVSVNGEVAWEKTVSLKVKARRYF